MAIHTLTVQTLSHPYPIFIRHDFIGQANVLLKPYLGKRVIAITNKTVAPLYLRVFQTVSDKLGISHFNIIPPDGEKYKN